MMHWLAISFVFAGQLSLGLCSGCSESNGADGSKTLSSPCPFTQIAANKNWNIGQIKRETGIFFRFEEMNCESYSEANSRISLTCSHTDQFYLMKPILSYGTSQNPTFSFVFASGSEVTYNDTEISIAGVLSQALGTKRLTATKNSGKAEFDVSVDPFTELNMENFINQRKEGAFTKLTLGNTLHNTPPRTASNAVITGSFSAINEDLNTPSNQNYELQISFGGSTPNQFYIFQRLIEQNSFEIAYYTEYSGAAAKPREVISNLGYEVNIPQGFSPVFDAASSAFSSSDGQIVYINNNSIRKIAEEYISQSSQAIILKGTFLYWHIDDPNSIKTLASDVPTAEEPPTPTNETSTLYDHSGELITDSSEENNKARTQELSKDTAKVVRGERKRHKKNEAHKSRSKRSTPSISLNDYMSIANQYLKKASKRTEDEPDFTERDKKIALNADFFEGGNLIELKSPEYLKGELDKVLKTFMPNYDIPGYASSLSTVSVIFSKIIIDITGRKMSLHCNISQSYDLVRNFIDGNGVTIIATTDLPTSSPQGRQEWEITGTGTIAVLQQLVKINLKAEGDYLYVKGKLEIANMTEFYNATGRVHYLTEELRRNYSRLTSFALTKLTIRSKIAAERLRLAGRCLIFAEPKTEEVFATERRSGVEDENPADLIYESKVRIILDNTTSLKYVVGILGHDIPFTAMMENMFKKNVTAASWLKFERLAIVLSKISMDGEVFTEPFLRTVEVSPGIHILANVLTPVEEDCKRRKDVADNPVPGVAAPSEATEAPQRRRSKRQVIEGDDNTVMENMFCMFLNNNPNVVNRFRDIKGKVNTTTYIFETMKARKKAFPLFPDTGNPIEALLIRFYLKVCNDKVFTAIKGKFRLQFNGNRVNYKGVIEFDATKGKMMLTLSKPRRFEQANNGLPFSIDKMRGGYSILGKKSREFQKFMVTSHAVVGTVEDKILTFNREAFMVFNVRDANELYLRGYIKNFENSGKNKRNALFEIFEAFGFNIRSHVMLQHLQSEQLTGVVYRAKEGEFRVEGASHNFKQGLNFYGTATVLGDKQHEFYVYYDTTSETLEAEIDLPYFQSSSLNGQEKYPLVFKRDDTNNQMAGGKMVVTANQQAIIVTLVGYLEGPGAGTRMDIPVESDGQFRVEMPAPSDDEPFKLFNEAPCRYTIRQSNRVSTFFEIDPKIIINLSPSKREIEQSLRDRLQEYVETISSYKSEDNFNRYETEVDGQVRTVRELMQETDNQMTELVDSMNEHLTSLSQDCVEKCAAKRVTVFGYRWQGGKYIGDDNAHEVADVTCITECEMIKPHSQVLSESTSSQLAELQTQFKRLRKQAEVMQQYLDLHYTYLRDLSQLMKGAARTASRILNKVDEVVTENNGEINFNLEQIRISQRVSNLVFTGNGSKCIRGFSATFELLEEAATTADLDLCFNGEFSLYAADAILIIHFGQRNIRKYYEKIDLAASREAELKSKTEKSIQLLKKMTQPEVDLKELSKEIVSTAPRPSEEEPTKKVRKAQEKKSRKKTNKIKSKASSQSYISYGKKNISIPAHTKRVAKTLKFTPHYSIKNPKTKRAFMYSSPWAAVKSLSLHKNESFDHLTPYAAMGRGSHCQQVSSVTNAIDTVRRSLSNYAQSFAYAKKHFTETRKFLLSGLENLKGKANKSGFVLNRQQQQDTMYWIRQFENGVQLYSTITDQKLRDHSENGFMRWKHSVESSLNRYGFGSIENLVNQFQATSIQEKSRSSIPNEQKAKLDQHFQYFSQGMAALIQNPGTKLESIIDSAKMISDSYEEMSSMIPSCA